MYSIYKYIYVYTCMIYTCTSTHPYSVLEGILYDQQPWVRCASARLATLLGEVRVSLGEAVVCARVGGDDVKGDAQITMMRGKRKHIYDYTITGTLNILDSESAGGTFTLGRIYRYQIRFYVLLPKKLLISKVTWVLHTQVGEFVLPVHLSTRATCADCLQTQFSCTYPRYLNIFSDNGKFK